MAFPPTPFARRIAGEDEVKLRSHAAAVSSSQFYTFNLFVGGREGPHVVLAAAVSDTLPLPGGPPARSGDRPAPDELATGIDVVLWGRFADRARAIVLVEVNDPEARSPRRPWRSTRPLPPAGSP